MEEEEVEGEVEVEETTDNAEMPETEDELADENQQQDKNCPTDLIEIIKNLPISNGSTSAGPVIIQQPILIAPSPATTGDSAPIKVGPAKIRTDIEVTDIQFVDLGTQSKDSGPRFRVFVKNHNNRFAVEGIQVDLAGGIDLQQDQAPRVWSSGTIEKIEPRAVATVDIRLSPKALSLVNPLNGQTQPFSQLAAVVEENQNFEEVDTANNLLLKDLNEVQHVAIQLGENTPEKLRANQKLVLDGEGFQFEKGMVVLIIDQQVHSLQVENWTPVQIQATVPNFVLLDDVKADLVVVRPDKTHTEPQSVLIQR